MKAGDLLNIKRWCDAIRERSRSQPGISVANRVGRLLEDETATKEFSSSAKKLFRPERGSKELSKIG